MLPVLLDAEVLVFRRISNFSTDLSCIPNSYRSAKVMFIPVNDKKFLPVPLSFLLKAQGT